MEEFWTNLILKIQNLNNALPAYESAVPGQPWSSPRVSVCLLPANRSSDQKSTMKMLTSCSNQSVFQRVPPLPRNYTDQRVFSRKSNLCSFSFESKNDRFRSRQIMQIGVLHLRHKGRICRQRKSILGQKMAE